MDLIKWFPIDVSTGGAALIWSFGGYIPEVCVGKAQIIAGEGFEPLRPVTIVYEKNGRHARYRLFENMVIIQANTNRHEESFSIYQIVRIDAKDKIASGRLIVQNGKCLDENGELTDCPEEYMNQFTEAVAAAIGTANTADCKKDYYSRRYA